MFTVFFRTIILYFLVILSLRLMGKKQLGELQPFELAITIMVSELASLPMQDTRIPILHGIIPIVTLLILEIFVSIFELKSEKFRIILNGKPSILVKKGIADVQELKHQKVTLDDLNEELRLKGFYNLEDIEYAILETSGQLSIIPKTRLSGVTKEDMNIKCSQDEIPITLIADGKVSKENLKLLNKDIHWLNQKLKEQKISSCEEVFIALINSKGKFYCQKKNCNEVNNN